MAAAIADAHRGEQGFTLVDTIIAMLILTVGLLALAQVFIVGLATLNGSAPEILAREQATEAIESVFAARDGRTVTWDEIQNEAGESGSDGGIFLDGEQALTTAGDDGIVNTADDGPVESIYLPGGDGELGTDDDLVRPLTSFTREIEIRSAGTNLRRVRVIIRYQTGGRPRTYTLDTFISSFS